MRDVESDRVGREERGVGVALEEIAGDAAAAVLKADAVAGAAAQLAGLDREACAADGMKEAGLRAAYSLAVEDEAAEDDARRGSRRQDRTGAARDEDGAAGHAAQDRTVRQIDVGNPIAAGREEDGFAARRRLGDLGGEGRRLVRAGIRHEACAPGGRADGRKGKAGCAEAGCAEGGQNGAAGGGDGHRRGLGAGGEGDILPRDA